MNKKIIIGLVLTGFFLFLAPFIFAQPSGAFAQPSYSMDDYLKLNYLT